MNFQNIPRDNKSVKRAFLGKRGLLHFFDYSQIEPRLFAYFAAKGLGDTTVADWYREGRDVYREIAGRAMSKAPDAITEEERQLGKVWFLMSMYGAGPRKMAQEIGMPEKEAKEFYRAFHDGLPQIKGLSNPPPRAGSHPSYRPGLVERALRRKGYLKTPFGMHLHAEQYGEHKMLNKLIQGTAALVMKRALVRVGYALGDSLWVMPGSSPDMEQRFMWRPPDTGMESRMVATIHDEIILDGPPSEAQILNDLLPGLMTAEPEITKYVPLEVDHEVSETTWADKIGYAEWLAGKEIAVG